MCAQKHTHTHTLQKYPQLKKPHHCIPTKLQQKSPDVHQIPVIYTAVYNVHL